MLRLIQSAFLAVLLVTAVASAQNSSTPSSSTPTVPSSTAKPFNVDAAVEQYLAKMPPARRAQSNAYFEGGYWLLLWDFLLTVIVMWLLLHLRWSARMRSMAERVTRFRPLQTAIYWIQFTLLTAVLTFPMTVYEGYVREHKYGLLNQTFGAWMRDQSIALAATVILGAILVIPIFGLVR